MCGLFGAIGAIDPREVLRLAMLAESRGGQAWGFTHDARALPDVLLTTKRIGTVEDGQGSLVSSIERHGPSRLVGLSRLATSGKWDNPRDAQPITSPLHGIAVAHNGNVYNLHEIYESHGWTPETNCDSEAIVTVLAKTVGTVYGRASAVLAVVDPAAPLAVLAMLDGKLAAIVRGHPVYQGLIRGGLYFCSRRFDGSSRLADGVYVYDPESVTADGNSIRRDSP